MLSQPQVVGQFIERLIEEKNFQNLDPEVSSQIKNDLIERVEDRINAVVLENMPPEKLEEFNALLDSANMEEVQMYCQKNIPNLDEVIAEALVDFRNTYLNS